MKKLFLATTAIAGFAMVATPAIADGLNLEVGGFYRGYVAYTDNDEATGDSFRDFDIRDDAEIHFSGETTLDNGLTIGGHGELDIAANFTNAPDEIYAYFSGSWGRVNFGHEDGAGYLLQVAAPSADNLVDGLRTRFQTFTVDLGGTLPAGFAAFDQTFDYDMDFARNAAKITYLTPKFNGFQAGVSFAPAVSDGVLAVGNGTNAVATDEDAGDFENLWELAARWDGNFEDVALTLGAGYMKASTEADNAANGIGSDDRKAWNVAANASMAGFSFGAAYMVDDYGQNSASGDGQETWVVGLGWDNGPYHAGVSYYESNYEYGNGANQDFDFERITFGGTYTYGPGMTFRGSVSMGTVDDNANPTLNRDVTQILLGTMVNF